MSMTGPLVQVAEAIGISGAPCACNYAVCAMAGFAAIEDTLTI